MSNAAVKYSGGRGPTRSLAVRSKAAPDRRASADDKNLAVTMWVNGCDTLAIATALNMMEHRIYIELPRWRIGQ